MVAELDSIYGNVAPHNIEAEQAVLGALMVDNTAADKVTDLLRPTDFYREDHQRIYRAMLALLDQSRPVDPITMVDELGRDGSLGKVGGEIYIKELEVTSPGAANIRHYAAIIREGSLKRNIAMVGNEMTESVLTTSGKTGRELLDEAEGKLFRLAEQGSLATQGFETLMEPLTRVVNRVDELYRAGSHDVVTGIPTGFVDMDEQTAGLQRGDLVIVAGRPSMGKTAFALNIADHVATDKHLPVAIFSMEMSSDQLATRLLGSRGRLDQKDLRVGRLDGSDFARMASAMGDLSRAPIHIDGTPALNPLDLRARARRLHRQYNGLGLIVIDYLQLMSSSGRGENRATEISDISRSLKSLAKELNTPVMALSQLNRGLEQRPNKRPVMSDLRESGAIEQDADLILFIYRAEVYNESSPDKGVAEVIIGKQRNGPIGTVRLAFQGQFTRFENFGGYGSGYAP